MTNRKIQPLAVSIPAAAEMLGCSRGMVYKLCDSGKLPSIRCYSDPDNSRAFVRVMVKDLEAFLENHRQTA